MNASLHIHPFRRDAQSVDAVREVEAARVAPSPISRERAATGVAMVAILFLVDLALFRVRPRSLADRDLA